MKKKFLMGATALVAGLALASCGGNDAAKELNTMSMFGGTDPHATAYEQFIGEFEKEHGVTVNDNSATSDEIWKTSVISSFYTGNEPDVLFFFTGQAAKPLVDNKKVVSIAEIRKEYPDFAKNVSDSVIDPYAVTLKGFVEGLFVNTDLLTGDLAKYKDKDNWTWDEFMAVCAGLHANGKTPVALGTDDVPHYWIEHLILGMNGKEAYSAIPSEKDINDGKAEGWVKALSMFHELAEANVFGASKGVGNNTDASQKFLKGEAGMILDGSWFAGQIKDDGTTKATQANVKMMPFPAIPTAKGGKNTVYMQSGFTSGFYISRKAWDNPAKRDLAVKFVEKMTSTSAIKEFCKVGGVPADNKVQLDGLTALGKSMNSMPGRTASATLPLSDASKSGSFANLVSGAAAYLSGDTAKIKEALVKFANAQ